MRLLRDAVHLAQETLWTAVPAFYETLCTWTQEILVYGAGLRKSRRVLFCVLDSGNPAARVLFLRSSECLALIVFVFARVRMLALIHLFIIAIGPLLCL